MKKFIYDNESNTWTGLYTEFPGCISQGDTAEEAERLLDEILIDWKEAAWSLEQEIPVDADTTIKAYCVGGEKTKKLLYSGNFLPCGHETYEILLEQDGYRNIRCATCAELYSVTAEYAAIPVAANTSIKVYCMQGD